MATNHLPSKSIAIIEDDNDPIAFDNPSTPPNVYTYSSLPGLDLSQERRSPFYEELTSVGRATSHIRLLDLLPGGPGEPLHCRLRSVHLGYDMEPYEALSYTWGDSKHDVLFVNGRFIPFSHPIGDLHIFRHPLWCDGQRLLISTNLRDALRRFRRPDSERTLWVDAVCINQEDHTERAAQVLLMPKIYHSATNVLFWIGEAEKHAGSALYLLKRFAESWRNGITAVPGAILLENGRYTPPLGSSFWKAIPNLFERPVFRRMWIVQEIVMARDIIGFCGPVKFDVRDVVDGARYLRESGLGALIIQHHGSTILDKYITNVLVSKLRLFFGHPSIKQELVLSTRAFEATDPRDKIFALMGMLNDHAHRHITDLVHGGDVIVDMMNKRGWNFRRTETGGLVHDMRSDVRNAERSSSDEPEIQQQEKNSAAGSLVPSSRPDVQNEEQNSSEESETPPRLQQHPAASSKNQTKETEAIPNSELPDIATLTLGKALSTVPLSSESLSENQGAPLQHDSDFCVPKTPEDEYERYDKAAARAMMTLAKDRSSGLGDAVVKYMLVTVDVLVRVAEQQAKLLDHTPTPALSVRYLDMKEPEATDVPQLLATVNSAHETYLEANSDSDPDVQLLIELLNDRTNENRLPRAPKQPHLEVNALISDFIEFGSLDQYELRIASREYRYLFSLVATYMFVMAQQEEEIEGGESSEQPLSELQPGRSNDEENRVVSIMCGNEEIGQAAFRIPSESSKRRKPKYTIDDIFKRAIERENTNVLDTKAPWGYWSSQASALTLPDYLMPTKMVFTEFTINQIEELESLWILSTVEDSSDRKLRDLPSWVPDYTVDLQQSQRHIWGTDLFEAADGSSASIQWSPSDPNILQVEAIILETISQVESGAYPARYPQYNRAWEWMNMAGHSHDIDGAFVTSEYVWRALLGDHVIGSEGLVFPAPVVYGQYYLDMMYAIQFEQQRAPDELAAREEIEAMLQDPAQSQYPLKYTASNRGRNLFREAVDKSMAGRIFFKAGNFFGMGPRSARQGDEVCLLMGGQVPFVIRRNDDATYTFVGECYFHAEMHGDKFREEDLKPIKLS